MLSLICQKQKDKYLWSYLHELSEMGGFIKDMLQIPGAWEEEAMELLLHG